LFYDSLDQGGTECLMSVVPYLSIPEGIVYLGFSDLFDEWYEVSSSLGESIEYQKVIIWYLLKNTLKICYKISVFIAFFIASGDEKQSLFSKESL